MSRIRKVIIFCFLFLFFGLLIYGWQGIYLPKDSFSEKEVVFNIEKGEGSREIALNLEKQDLIKWGPIFRLFVHVKGISGKLQAGEYLISPSMNILEMADKFAKGDVAKEEITIIEGWTLKDIGFYFENKGMFQAEELYDEKSDVEGYFFPDTYQIRRGATLEEIINKARDNFNKKTADLEITPEIIIMASILEKEVKAKEEKELASDVLWKRLEIGMPLQVDCWPETYERTGLPEKPIANPGLESIRAAISPKESPYWYYLSTPEGETIFSKTLEEHNILKAQYLK